MPIKKGTPPHPGEILKKFFLDASNVSIKSLAEQIGESRKTISDIVNGLSYITPDLAGKYITIEKIVEITELSLEEVNNSRVS